MGAILAQVRPSVITAVTLYQPGASVRAGTRRLYVANTDTSNAAVITIYAHKTGTTYDTTTMIVPDTTLSAGGGVTWQFDVPLLNSEGGSIGVKTDLVDKVVFTLIGVERDE